MLFLARRAEGNVDGGVAPADFLGNPVSGVSLMHPLRCALIEAGRSPWRLGWSSRLAFWSREGAGRNCLNASSRKFP
jgi:hypothetical protein